MNILASVTLLAALQAPETLVQSVGAAKSGSHELRPAHHECPGGTPHIQGIACGSTTSDALTSTGSCVIADDSYIDFYSFNGVAGQQVAITMTSTAFDTFLFLIGIDASTIATNDDISPGNTNSGIVFTLSETGTYVIGANSFPPNQFGGYTLTLTCSGGVAPPPDIPTLSLSAMLFLSLGLAAGALAFLRRR